MAVRLTGLGVSVYTRIVRLMLIERQIAYDFEEIDPFAGRDVRLVAMMPFHLVPVLHHDGFTLYETSAILRYLDLAFEGVSLVPDMAQAAARMAQVISIVDTQGYRPLVRQVFAQRVYAAQHGEPVDEAAIAEGLRQAATVLGALEGIAQEGLVLGRARLTLADLHLAPMIGYFQQAPEGAAMLRTHPALFSWWQWISARPSFAEVDLPVGPGGLASSVERL